MVDSSSFNKVGIIEHANFGDLAQVLRGPMRDSIVLFFGAGMSRLADESFPDWQTLLRSGVEFLRKRPEGNREYCDEIMSLVERRNYLYGAWLIKDRLKDKAFRDFLALQFQRQLKYAQSIKDRLRLFLEKTEAELILTTNFDCVLETTLNEGLKQDNWTVRTNCTCRQAREEIVGRSSRVVFKLHGTIEDPESLIVTHEDYQRLYCNQREYTFLLSRLLDSHTFIFLGFSLDDPFFTHVIDVYSSYFAPYQQTHYAFVPSASNAEMVAWDKLRGIKLIPMGIGSEESPGDYLGRYCAVFDSMISVLRGGESQFRTPNQDTGLLAELGVDECRSGVPVRTVSDPLSSLRGWRDWAGRPEIVQDEGRPVIKVRYTIDKKKNNNSSIFRNIGRIPSGAMVNATVEFKCVRGKEGMLFVGDSGGLDPYDNSTEERKEGTGEWESLTAQVTYKHDDVCAVFLYGNKYLGKDEIDDFVLYRNLELTVYGT